MGCLKLTYNYPVGALEVNRKFSEDALEKNALLEKNRLSSYTFGFNGMEKDDEVFNQTGTSYTAEFWQYDSRIGRRWNVDPVDKPWMSSYHAFSNNPITNIDPNGDNDTKYQDKDGNLLIETHDGSDDVVTVPDEHLDEFKKHQKHAKNPIFKDIYNSAGFNNIMRNKFGVGDIKNPKPGRETPFVPGAIDFFKRLTDEEGAARDYFRNPSLETFGTFVLKRIANQFTNPMNYAPGPKIFKGRIKPKYITSKGARGSKRIGYSNYYKAKIKKQNSHTIRVESQTNTTVVKTISTISEIKKEDEKQ